MQELAGMPFGLAFAMPTGGVWIAGGRSVLAGGTAVAE